MKLSFIRRPRESRCPSSATMQGVEMAYFALLKLPILQSSEKMAKIIDLVAQSQSIETVVLSVFWLHRGLPEFEISKVIETLQSNGKRVLLTKDVPYFSGLSPASCKVSPAIGAPRRCDFEPYGFVQVVSHNKKLRATSSTTGATFVDTYGIFCQDKKCSMSGHVFDQVPEALFYRDASHLNTFGSLVVGRELARYIGLSDPL